jgi:WD40 repeat protein
MRLLTGDERRIRALAVSPDGSRLASANGDDKHICLWAPASGQPVTRLWGLSAPVAFMAFAPRGRTLGAAERSGGAIHLWDPKKPRPRLTLRTGRYGSGGFAFAADGKTLARREWEGWNAKDARIEFRDTATGKAWLSVPAQQFGGDCLAFAPVGLRLASVGHRWVSAGDGQRVITIWDVLSRQEQASFAQRESVSSLTFAPDGRTLLVAAQWGSVLWDVNSQRARPLWGHTKPIPRTGIAFTPDGRTLVTAGEEKVVRCWDVETGYQRAALDLGLGRVYAVAVAPDGMRAFAGGEGGIVEWDLD